MGLLYQRILSTFPQTSLRSAFAYGSSVYKQIGQANRMQEMIDFIIIVDDPLVWHKENISQNPSHYSSLRFLGTNFINRFHKIPSGPGVYFNTLISWEHHLIKYGVVSTKSIVEDLEKWKYIYLSGRLHKPVYWIYPLENDVVLSKSIHQNLKQALSIALLLLPETFNEEELFQQICNLSYNGDFRMIFGEDKAKVKRLVFGHETDFRRLYSPLLTEIPQVDWKSSAYSDLLLRDDSVEGRKALLLHLPSYVLEIIRNNFGFHKSNNLDDKQILKRLSEDYNCAKLIGKALESIVFRSSVIQSLINLPTAGFMKSMKYSIRKISKMMGSSSL